MNNRCALNNVNFEDFRFLGLYAGLRAPDVQSRKAAQPNHNIRGSMGYTELAVNLFCCTQSEEKITRENIQTTAETQHAYLVVGQSIRQAIKELGGIMPEDLPLTEINQKRRTVRNRISINARKPNKP